MGTDQNVKNGKNGMQTKELEKLLMYQTANHIEKLLTHGIS
jgi:hypothetical protein